MMIHPNPLNPLPAANNRQLFCFGRLGETSLIVFPFGEMSRSSMGLMIEAPNKSGAGEGSQAGASALGVCLDMTATA